MSITPLPDPPTRTDRTNFRSRADAFVAALPGFVADANALAVEVGGLKDDAESARDAAQTAQANAASAESVAVAAANFAGAWSDLTGAVTVPTSVSHNGYCWLLLDDLADVTVSEPGVTADWEVIVHVPSAHAPSHASGGSDPITPENIGAEPAGAVAGHAAVSASGSIAGHIQCASSAEGLAREDNAKALTPLTGGLMVESMFAEDFEILTPDPLRKSIEAATGGMCTVLYDDFDLPNYMRIIPAMNATDLGLTLSSYTGLHPAFLVDGTAIPELFIGMYQASAVSVSGTDRAVSQPHKTPWVSIDFDNARAACIAKGSGWHLMTNWEWAAVALWCMANDMQPRGNTNHGRAHDAVHETGTRQDGDTYVPGDSSGVGNVLTGSGPYAWRHDATPAGISDLVGNVWEWNDGLKIVAGAVKMLNDNDISLCTSELDESSWPDQSFAVVAADPWSSLDSTGDNDLLRLALVSPGGGVAPQGRFYVDNTDTRLPRRGGSRGHGANAGLAALSLNNLRSNSNSKLGFRPAFVSL